VKPDTGPVILFDGVCNLCNSAVQFVIRHDKNKVFRFASLQSEAGQSMLAKYDLPANDFNSFVLVQNDRAYTSSTAALLTAKQLSGPVKLLYGFIIIPAFIRNAVYRLIANNRYRWFGKKESCMIPTPDLRSRFLN
jgi:predicted DCC family thiol-disulfide oxidoreductase YuxK